MFPEANTIDKLYVTIPVFFNVVTVQHLGGRQIPKSCNRKMISTAFDAFDLPEMSGFIQPVK
jgi:hypothetical protein